MENLRRFMFTGLLMLVVVVSGCGGGGGGSAPATTSTTNATAASNALFTAAADPVNVTVTTDSARAASQVVTTAGATLNATAADGSQFTLVIPANAVLQDTTIMMTPIASMTGLPFANGLVAAVQFAPDGLFLEKDAMLTIVPTVTVPVVKQTFIGYLGTGNDLHLVPPASPTTAIQMLVSHFSGVGLANGTSTERASMYLKIAADYEARLTQEIARILARERELAILGVDNVDEPSPFDLADLYKSYYELVVRARMLAASSSCANATIALQTYLGFERKYQIMGLTNPHDPGEVDYKAILKAKDAACTVNAAGNLQFVLTGQSGAYTKGSADITWNLRSDSNIAIKKYWPTGTITADIAHSDCDPVHVTKPISATNMDTPYDATDDGGGLDVYSSMSFVFPSTYWFWLHSDNWDQTFQCGNPRQPTISKNYSLWLEVGTCTPGFFIPYTDAANLTGTLSCANYSLGSMGGKLDATWDFKNLK